MRGLTVVVTNADRERFEAALTLACAQAALGGRVRVYCHDTAVRLLTDASALRRTACEMGVTLIACQSGLAAAELAFEALGADVEAGGMVGLLADLGDDRLVTL